MKTDQLIWNQLIEEIKNPYGVAGLMGNLYAESSMNPKCMTEKNKPAESLYILAINSGAYSREQFSKDGIAFGLAQWRYWSRKEALYDWAKGKDISDPAVQVGFLLNELKTYKTVWKTLLEAKTIQEASDIVLTKYEKPANTSDKVKELRTKYGQGYFDEYASESPLSALRVRTAKVKVNLRSGNGKEYASVRRVPEKGTEFDYVAAAENGWYAISDKQTKRVLWISKDCAELIYE